MKRMYKQYIKIPENEKISDSILKSRIILSAIVILSCITVMISTAIAFFRVDMEKNYEMRSAVWDIAVEEKELGKVSSFYKCARTPEEGEWHEFTIYARGTASEGYCEIIIKSPDGKTDKYYTDIFTDETTVSIQAVSDCEIKFNPKWGNPVKRRSAKGPIVHSYTEPESEEPTTEGGETSTSSETTQGEEKQTESLSNTLGEASSGETETPSAGEPSMDNSGDSSTEGSSVTSGETSPSAGGSATTETTSTPTQPSGDGGSSSSSGDAPSGNSSSSESSSATGDDSASSSESFSASSEPSSGDGSSE